MYNRVYSFVETHDILYKNQYGFRRKHSTVLAMVELVDTIYQNLDQNKYVLGIFLDLQKAFDTVDHDILLYKLYRYGIRGTALHWFKSYLKNRQQYTIVNEHSSKLCSIKTGVPQGSIIGPLLFLLYVNDIKDVVDSNRLKLFADDTNLFLYNSDLQCLIRNANEELQALYQWLLANKLSLNITKTCYSIFAPNKKHRGNPNYTLMTTKFSELTVANT